MGRGRKTSSNRGRKRVRINNVDSEDSDEEYVAEVDETDDQSDEMDSLVRDGSEEESAFEEEEEEEEESEEEDEYKGEEDEDEGDENEDEGQEWRTIAKPRNRKVSARPIRKGVKRPRKRKIVKSDEEEDFDEADDDGDDDDGDEEFTPDEVDSLDEDEEVSVPRTKTKKRGRTVAKGKRSTRSQASKRGRKTRARAVRKPLKKKTKRSSNTRRKEKSDEDEDFIENGPVLRGRSKKKPVRGKRRMKNESDSDFCSDPSDYEFTISEEEREQVREANEICRRASTSFRNPRRILENETLCEPRKPLTKGKEKAEETKNDTGKPVCGICLTEEKKNTIRGLLNCCSHYFCFTCIVEWSKVESRCPLCKQRFITITKATKCSKGFDLRNNVVQVPERDQVYQPTEEELRDFLNPYENVICTECHQGGDDNLMLLCDLCDSPAHTYCVGLGREVPEGNWYCDGCRPTAFAPSYSQTQDLSPGQGTSADATEGPSAYENMREIDLNVTIPETPVSQWNGFVPSPRYLTGSVQAPSPVSRRGASTVSSRLFEMRSNSNRMGLSVPRMADLREFQQNIATDVGTSYHVQHVDRPRDHPSHSAANRDFFFGRSDHTVRLVGQASRPSTSRDGLAYGPTHFRHSQYQTSSSEPFLPRFSRSSIRLDVGARPPYDREEGHSDLVEHQILSTVKDQLKRLFGDNLSHDACSQITRRSLDAIKAACGLLHRDISDTHIHELRAPTFCAHLGRCPDAQTSPLNNCCLTCFEGFVRDALVTIGQITPGSPNWIYARH